MKYDDPWRASKMEFIACAFAPTALLLASCCLVVFAFVR